MDSPSEHNDYLREMVKEGRATLHQLLVDGKRVGLTITTVEIHSAGRELVSIATYSNNTLGITPALSEALEEMARHENCQCIRLHTARHGLVKLATENYGFRISEIVLRKNING